MTRAATMQVDWMTVGKGSASHAFIDGRYWIALCRLGPAGLLSRKRQCVRCVRELARLSDPS